MYWYSSSKVLISRKAVCSLLLTRFTHSAHYSGLLFWVRNTSNCLDLLSWIRYKWIIKIFIFIGTKDRVYIIIVIIFSLSEIISSLHSRHSLWIVKCVCCIHSGRDDNVYSLIIRNWFNRENVNSKTSTTDNGDEWDTQHTVYSSSTRKKNNRLHVNGVFVCCSYAKCINRNNWWYSYLTWLNSLSFSSVCFSFTFIVFSVSALRSYTRICGDLYS